MSASPNSELKKTDPDPVSILTLVVAGVALLPVLEQKLEARRSEKKREDDEKARRSCALALARISVAIEVIDGFVTFFDSIGDFRQLSLEMEHPAGFGTYGLFISTADISLFSDQVDKLLIAIGTINREVLSMPLNDLTLSEKDLQSMYAPLRNIRASANEFLFYPTLELGLQIAPKILQEGRHFSMILSAVTNTGR